MNGEEAERLKQIEAHSNTLLEGQRVIHEAVGDLQKQMRNVLTELGGAPDVEYRDPNRKSMRTRMHDFEDFITANTLATEALRTARDQLETARSKQWSRGQKISLFVFAAAAAAEGLLRLFGVGG